ncbi:hypothetical protein [Cerasicoccus fimbriatus]|uniref:hypothetical protein n=1 Tax=Cerasicoccus fimbriatus TaxID=3014554 RepID=UPI0022B2D6BC|nr:hypothetical protein [Cerasicoccus sp. TK19100]
MKAKITERLKHVGRGYDLDKLPPALLETVIDAASPLIEAELGKAEERAIQKIITEKFVAKVIKSALEAKPARRSRATAEQMAGIS